MSLELRIVIIIKESKIYRFTQYFEIKLLYSCKNINADHFKLSKVKNLYLIIFL